MANDAPLKDVLKELLQNRIYRTKINEVRVRLAWKATMGEVTLRYTDKIEFKDGVLKVTLTSAPLRNDLTFKKMAIITALHAEIGESIIKTLEIY
jgi:predicted nucleic acid-binding Zn ribbon protein